MNKLIESVKRAFQKQTRAPAQQLTRAKARAMILSQTEPPLEREGFLHRKGNNVWRIADNRTDVIELRFLTLEEKQQFELPASAFSLLYGLYYHFIPDIYEGQFLHRIPALITPQEVDCHYRGRTRRSIKQKPKKMDMTAWHLDEPGERQTLVLEDVLKQLEADVFPTLNRFADVGQWIQFLESDEADIEMGEQDSLARQFLLGFSYEYLNELTRAKTHFLRAKQLCEEFIEVNSGYPEHLRLEPNSDHFKTLDLLNQRLSRA